MTRNRKPSDRRPTTKRVKPRAGVPDALTDKARGRRLQKVLAEAGVASRRDCEDLIRTGRVKVNGEAVTALPAWVDPDIDRVEVDGEPVRGTGVAARQRRKREEQTGAAHVATDRLIYVALNKPKRIISTTRDPEGRTSITDLVELPEPAPGVPPPRLFPVGRLDADSTGLILLTNDGELTNHLTHPRYGVIKQYRVTVQGRLDDEHLEQLRKGLFLTDRRKRQKDDDGAAQPGARKAAMEQVERIGQARDAKGEPRTDLLVTLREGQNREIRRLLARLGHKVRRLHRVRIGPLTDKGLAVGHWRYLSTTEVHRLRRAAGMAPAKNAGKSKS